MVRRSSCRAPTSRISKPSRGHSCPTAWNPDSRSRTWLTCSNTLFGLQPLPDLLLVFVVDEAQHQQHYAQGHETQNAIEGFQLPHVEDHHATQRAREHAQPEVTIHPFP